MFGLKFVKFLMSILKWQINSSSNFASFFIVITHSSFVNFRLIHFLLCAKEFHQSPNFDTFECSDENFSNFLCHFSNNKSVFLQILHSVMKDNSSLLFRWNIKGYFCYKIIFCHKVTVDVQLINFFIWNKRIFHSWDIKISVFL